MKTCHRSSFSLPGTAVLAIWLLLATGIPAIGSDPREGGSEERQGASRGKGKGRGITQSGSDAEGESNGEFVVSLTAIKTGEISFASGSGGGRGRGRGKRSGDHGDSRSMPVAEDILVTTGRLAKRTQEFQPGQELGAGLSNRMFDGLRDGETLKARVVIKSGRAVELNVIVDDVPMEDAIAVKPKRPPMKKGGGR